MNEMNIGAPSRRHGLIAYIPGTEAHNRRRNEQAALQQSIQAKLADKTQRDAQLKNTIAQQKLNDELAEILKRQVLIPKEAATAYQRGDSGRMRMLNDEDQNLSAAFTKLVRALAVLKNADRKLSGAILDSKISDVLDTTAKAIVATIGLINPSNINETNTFVNDLLRELERGIDDMFRDEDAEHKALRPVEDTFTEADLSPQLREKMRAELEAQRASELNQAKKDFAAAETFKHLTSQGQQALADARALRR